MLKQKYFLTGIFILSAERQPIKLSWRKIVWLLYYEEISYIWFGTDTVAFCQYANCGSNWKMSGKMFANI